MCVYEYVSHIALTINTHQIEIKYCKCTQNKMALSKAIEWRKKNSSEKLLSRENHSRYKREKIKIDDYCFLTAQQT